MKHVHFRHAVPVALPVPVGGAVALRATPIHSIPPTVEMRRLDRVRLLEDSDLTTASASSGDERTDNPPNIVVGNFEALGVVYFNLGSGRTPTLSGMWWNDGKGGSCSVAVGSLDGDGWPEPVGARSDARNGIWFNGPARRLQ